jgi:ribokinase
MTVVVVGQVARDLVLRLAVLPDAGGSAPVEERHELLGGKGANQAVGLAQLDLPVALVAVAGADAAGAAVLEQARQDGIDTAAVRRRGTTALLVDVVEASGARRLLEHVPPESLLTIDDVQAAADVLRGADTVLLQLQQPGPALVQAVRLTPQGARVVLDGGTDDRDVRRALLGRAQVVRADAAEAAQLSGVRVLTVDDAREAARGLLGQGPDVVALAVPGAGDLVVWRDGEVLLPLAGEVVDPTGAGDAFVVGLTAALRNGRTAAEAAQVAAATSRRTVGRLGGRPDLDPAVLEVGPVRA